MRSKYFLRAAAALTFAQIALFGTASCGGKVEIGNDPIEVYTIEKQDLQNFISVSGTVKGANVVNITSDISAKVAKLNVEVGSQVKAGDVLCVFDSTALQEEYDTLKKSADTADSKTKSLHDINARNLETAKSEKQTALERAQRVIDNATKAKSDAEAKLASLDTERNNLKTAYDSRYNALIAAGMSAAEAAEECSDSYQLYYSKEEEYNQLKDNMSSYDDAIYDANTAYSDAEKSADSAIQSAQDAIDAEQYDTDDSYSTQLAELEKKIAKCTVKAERDGIVTALNVAEGSIPTTEAIMTIEDDSKLSINVSISENDILKVSEGQKAVITTSATGDTEFEGKVGRVVKIISGQTRNINTGQTETSGYSAEIEIGDNSGELLIGMNAKVKIILDEKSDVIAVPYDAITKDDDDKFSVFVAEGSSGQKYTVKTVPVEKGLESNYFTEIISDEISEGDMVITEPGLVSDGESIEVAEGFYESADDSEGN